MTGRPRHRATSRTHVATLAIAGVILGGSALTLAGQAGAEPILPTPVPGAPGAPPAPGQPVVEEPGAEPVAAPAPPPVGEPLVPEVPNAVYGQGNSSGTLGFLRDAFNQAKNPYGEAPPPSAPPPGAGPAPQLPPGYTSLNAPGSNGPPVTGSYSGGPPLPEGYYPLNGPPPPPSYFEGQLPPDQVPAGPPPYQPVISPPPPPLLPVAP